MEELQQCMSKALLSEGHEVPAADEVNDPDPLRASRMAQLRRQGQKLLGGVSLR